MKVSSIEYKELVAKLAKDLTRVADDLYEAIEEKLPEARRVAIIAAGQRKLSDYAALLDRVSDSATHRAEVEKRFTRQMRDIQGFLKTLAT